MTERVILEPGQQAPNFSLKDQHGNTVKLSELRGSRVVLFAYPAAMTPGCTTQACDCLDSLASLQGAGYSVVGISPDPVAKLKKFADKEGLPFPLLADPDHEVALAYAAWGEKKNYGKTYEGLIRSTFVVDPDGTLSLAQYNVRATGHVAKLRRDLGLA